MLKKISYHIPVLNDYNDWLDKAKYNFEKYQNSYGVYDLADCLLTLNALPEWIAKSDSAPENLKNIAKEKLAYMSASNGFIFDETQFDDINQKLRFIRIFCNFSKHSAPKNKFPKIEMSSTLPASFPIKFENISIGDRFINASAIIKDVITFWDNYIDKK